MHTAAELLRRIGSQDEDAFEALYDRYYAPVLRQIRRIVRSEDQSEDVVQEVFLKVWRKSEQWKGRGSVASWIFRIATNLALNHLKSHRRRQNRRVPYGMQDNNEDILSQIADTISLGPEETVCLSERLRFIDESVAQLSEEKREVLKIYLNEEFTLNDISARLDLPLGTVKSRFHYAVRDLRKKLKEEE